MSITKTKRLTVLVHGAGFAGQGHANAFRFADAKIIGVVGRTEAIVKQVAEDLDIPYAGTDWAQALADLKPDIVTIGTPGGAHYDAIKQAIAADCHVFSDKPLATSGAEALELRELAKAKGVKTAFAASFRYMPEIMHAKHLVANGAIGEVQEVECISHFNLEKDIPFGWSHRSEQGGGRLNNNFTHKLSIVTSVVGEKVLAIKGDVRDDLGKAPIVEGVHNFKSRRDFIPKDLTDPALQWGESNVEWSYTVLARVESPFASQPVSVLFKHGGLQPRFNEDYIAFYGSSGAIYIKGHYGDGPLYLYQEGNDWREVPLPADIAADIPDSEDDADRNWKYLAREFVRDINGERAKPYQSFETGSFYQSLIDLLRENGDWIDVTGLRD
jgi:predicted dehydrogenase